MLWHAFLCPCTARTAVPAPRGCLRRCRRINLPPCEKMCPSTQDLLRVRGVRAVSLLPSRLALSLPAALRSHPFTNSPDSIMWQLLFGPKCCRLPCPEAEGVSEPSQDHLETTSCLTVWRTEAGAAAKTSAFDGTWRQRWPSRSGCLKLAIPSLDSGSKIGRGGAVSTGGTHSTELLHIMDQAARWLVLPGSHGPLGPWSWVFPKRCY